MSEPIRPTVIDTTRPIIRVAENPAVTTGRESQQGEVLDAREEKFRFLSEIKNEKETRKFTEAIAANKTGFELQKEKGAVTHADILNQLENAGKEKNWDINNIKIGERLDKSFGWEVEEVNGEQKFKLDNDALKRKEKTANTVDAAAKYIEKSFDGLSPAEQRNIIDKIRAGLSGVDVYDAICKADADGGKARIAGILKDDALRNQMELKLVRVLKDAENKQETLAADINNAKEALEIKKAEPDIINRQIELKNKELELNKKNQKDYETKEGVKGSKVLEKEAIGPVDTILIDGNNKRIEEVNKEVIKIDDKLNGFKTEDAENSRKIERQKDGIKDNEANIKQLQDSKQYYEDQKKTEKDPTRLSTLDTMIKERDADIKKLEKDNLVSKSIIDKCQNSIDLNKEKIEEATAEKNMHMDEIGSLKAENEPEEKKRDLLKNIDDQHKKLLESEKKIAQELSDLKISKIEKGQEMEAAELILNDLIDKKVKSEEGMPSEIESVYRKAVFDYLADKVKDSQEAEREVERQKEETDETKKNFYDALDKEWYKDSKRKDGWFGKKFDTKVINKDKINDDFGKLLTKGPDEIVRRILEDKCGLEGDELEKKLLDPEFSDAMRDKVIRRLLANKLQVGQLTGSEISMLALNTEWGKKAIDKGVADNNDLMNTFNQMKEKGVVKGSKPAEWMNQIMKADGVDSKKKTTILGILAAILLGTVGAGLAGGYKEIWEASKAGGAWVLG